MFLPAQYLWLEPVIIAAIVVFVIDLVGNAISFSNRFANALVTAVVFGIVFGALVYFGYGNISMTLRTTPSATADDRLPPAPHAIAAAHPSCTLLPPEKVEGAIPGPGAHVVRAPRPQPPQSAPCTAC